MPDHTDELRHKFASIYSHPDDIDLFPAAVTERSVFFICTKQLDDTAIDMEFRFRHKIPYKFLAESQHSIVRHMQQTLPS